MKSQVTVLPGLALSALIATVAYLIVSFEQAMLNHAVIEALVAALLIGMAVRNLIPLPAATQAGSSFAAKQLLEFAVVLLGATIDAQAVLRAGALLLAAVAILVVGGMTISYALGRLIGLPTRLAILVAVGNSICGNSAIAAVAPAIRAEKRDVASAVALTAVVGVALVLSLPVLIPVLALSHNQYGILAGLTVYAVPQVIAASFPVSEASGQIALLVKLIRVLFIGPVVVFFSLLYADRTQGQDRQWRRAINLPWFVAGFMLLMLLRSLGALPEALADVLREASRILTVIAMAALGLGVEIAAVKKVGPPVFTTVVGSLAFLVLLALGLILGLGL